MGVETIPVPKERQPGPYKANRACKRCGAKPLSRYNGTDLCAPCNGGDWDPPTPQPHPAFTARLNHERDFEAAA